MSQMLSHVCASFPAWGPCATVGKDLDAADDTQCQTHILIAERAQQMDGLPKLRRIHVLIIKNLRSHHVKVVQDIEELHSKCVCAGVGNRSSHFIFKYP